MDAALARRCHLASRFAIVLGIKPHTLSVDVKSRVNEAYVKQWTEGYDIKDRSRDLIRVFDPRLSGRKSMEQRLRSAKDRRVYGVVERWLANGRYNVSLAHREAQDAVAMFEDDVNDFGYSLLELGRYPEMMEKGTL